MNWSLLFVTLIVLAFLVGFVYYGVFPPGNPGQKMVESFEVLYKVIDQGLSLALRESLESLEKELQGFEVFKKCQIMRLLLDEQIDPRNDELREDQKKRGLSTSQHTKLIVGYAVVSEDSTRAAKEIIAANPTKYKLAKFPRTLTMTFSIPHRNFVSFSLIPYCWERILKTLITEGLGKKLQDYY